jgi:general secretion pathway protein A
MYAEFYGLRALPFRLTPDSRFFYPSQMHKGALAYLTYGLQKSEGFVLITGDVGTGKTVLVDYLLSVIDRERYRTCKILTTQMTPDDTIRMVASGFGLDPDGTQKASTVRQLETFFVDARRRNVRPVIIVDEVHNLPRPSLEELRMLSNYCFMDTPLVQTFLLGQTSSGKPWPTVRSNRSNSGWSPAVTSARSALARPAATSSIGCARVHQVTRGIPRRINMVFDRLLLVGYVEERHDIGADLVDIVMKELRRERLLTYPAPADGARRV